MFSHTPDADGRSQSRNSATFSDVQTKAPTEINRDWLKQTGRKLRILHLEDSKSDALLIDLVLKKSKLDFESLVVDTKNKFIKALKIFSPDIILADHSLPSFNSHDALETLHKAGIKIPFILITATMSDEFAIDVINRGADDYILKDRLNRLPVAIHNALERFRREEERQLFFDELTKKEKRYHALVENGNDAIVIFDLTSQPLYVSRSMHGVLGYEQEEAMKLRIYIIVHPGDREVLSKKMAECLSTPGIPIEGCTVRIKHKDGIWRWIEATFTNMLHEPALGGIISNFHDVTHKKLAEEKISHLNRLYAFLSQINQAIVHSPDEQQIFKAACDIAIEIGGFKAAWIGTIDVENQKINLVESSGILTEDLPKFTNVFYADNGLQNQVLLTGTYYVCNNIPADLQLKEWKSLAEKRGYGSCIVLPLKRSGITIATLNLYASEFNFFTLDEVKLLVEATEDISFTLDVFERQKQKLLADDLIKHKELHLKQAQAIAHLGSWELNFASGILTWSDEALRIYGLSPEESQQTYESWISFIHPDDLDRVLQVTWQAESTLSNSTFAYRIIRKDKTVRYVFSKANFEFNNKGQPVGLYGITHDVTEIRDGEAELKNSESNLHAIFENTSEGFILTDTAGMIQSFNKKSKDIILLNIEKEIKLGDSIFDFIEKSREGNYKNDIAKVITGITLQYDYPYKRKSGETKWFNFTINPVRRAGKIEGLCVTSADITERKISEELLLTSQSNLQAIIENTDASIYSIDSNFRYLTFNQLFQNSIKEMYGLNIKPGDDVFDFLERLKPKESREWKDLYSRAFKGEIVKFEKEFIVSDVCRYMSYSVYPIRENKKVIGLSCFTFDITKQKMTENVHLQTEARYRQIVETTQEGVWLIDEKNMTTFVNKKMCEILEYSVEEMMGKENTYFMDDAGKKAAALTLERRKKGLSENIDLRFITKSGRYIWANVSANPVLDDKGEYLGALGMVTDITEKKNLENLLNKANKLARIGTWEVDLPNNTLYWSDITRQIHEVPADFIPELTTALNFYKEGDVRAAISLAVKGAIENGSPFDLELQIVTAKGNERWVRSMGEGEYNDGKCIRLSGSFQDINNSKMAELEILKVYEEKNTILESIGDAFFAVDKYWAVTYWNNQAEKMLQVSKNKILGQNLWDVFSDSIDSESYRKYHQAIETNRVMHFEDNYSRVGKYYWISAYPSKNGLSVFFKDITEQKKSDDERAKMTADILRRNKDLEQFSYIISHNLRAPVANIIGFSNTLQSDRLTDNLRTRVISGLSSSVNKLDEVIKDLNNILNVRSEAHEKKQLVNLTKVVNDIELKIEDTIRNERAVIKIDFTEIEEMLTIKSYLYNIFYSLISNSLKYRQPDVSPVIEIQSRRGNDKIILLFKDNGLGIDMKKRDKQVFGLYKRFHTDRAQGRGIGLYMVKTQVESIGGEITVMSEVNKGTEFKIEFRNDE